MSAKLRIAKGRIACRIRDAVVLAVTNTYTSIAPFTLHRVGMVSSQVSEIRSTPSYRRKSEEVSEFQNSSRDDVVYIYIALDFYGAQEESCTGLGPVGWSTPGPPGGNGSRNQSSCPTASLLLTRVQISW